MAAALSSHKRWCELSQPEKLSRWLAHQVWSYLCQESNLAASHTDQHSGMYEARSGAIQVCSPLMHARAVHVGLTILI